MVYEEVDEEAQEVLEPIKMVSEAIKTVTGLRRRVEMVANPMMTTTMIIIVPLNHNRRKCRGIFYNFFS